MVPVGTIIADRPPHRTVRAALPHTAPTLEDWRAVLLLAHRSSPGTLNLRSVWLCAFADRASFPFGSRRSRGLPVLVHVVSQRARVLRLRRTVCSLAFIAKQPCCLPPIRRESAPWFCVFRSSIARPTDTPVYASSDISRKTEGQDGVAGECVKLACLERTIFQF
jgi:hypothetical protein